MRLVFGLALTLTLIALVWASPTLFSSALAPALAGPANHLEKTPFADASLLQRAKIVCGQTPEGFRCRNEPGAIRQGKNRKVPTPRNQPNGSDTSGGWFGSESGSSDPDALPAAPADGTSGGAAAGTCPPNTERLGGHCIPYTQTCNRGLAAGAPPQVCRGAEEKLVCDFRPDGLKDCCCRTYSQ